jgi:DDE superfamily endonuclease
LSRYGPYSERTYRRHYQKDVPFLALNAQSIATAIAPGRIAIGAIDSSFIRKSGSKTWGLDKFYNGTVGKSQKGLEISVISVVDVAAHQGYTLSVHQTAATVRPPAIAEPSPEKKNSNPKTKTDRRVSAPKKKNSKGDRRVSASKKKNSKGKSNANAEPVISERVQGYIAQLQKTRPYFPTIVKYLAADSFYSKKVFVDAVVDLRLHLVCKLRIDAALQYCYVGEQNKKGAPRKYGGKVDLNDLSKLPFICDVEPSTKLYSQVVWHVSLKRKIRIVYLVNLEQADKPHVALLFSTDTELDPEQLYAYYKARFQIEFIFRDAKQFVGLCDCQSRQAASLDFHFNLSLMALNMAKIQQQQSQSVSDTDEQALSFSMATYKRQALNSHLLERFITLLELDPTLIKSHPNYENLLHYGSLTL